MGTARRKSGVLAGEVEPYRDWLTERGYTPGSIRLLQRNLSHLGVWLTARGLPGSPICADSVHAMFAERRRQGRRLVPGERGATGLLGFLRERGVLVEAVHEPSPLEQLLALSRLAGRRTQHGSEHGAAL